MSHRAKLILQELKAAVTDLERNLKGHANFQQIADKLNSEIEFLEGHLKDSKKSFRYEEEIYRIADCYRKAVECLGTENQELADAAERFIVRPYAHIEKRFSEANKFIVLDDKNSSAETLDLESGERVGYYKLQKIKSKTQLGKMGKVFDNCLADRERREDYHERIQDNKLEVWLVLQDDKPFCLISLNKCVSVSEIEEVEHIDNKNFRFPYTLAMEILNKLNANADRHAEFARVGAFRVFVNKQLSVDPDVVGDRLIWIWKFKDEIIIAMKDRHQIGDDLYWSRFFRTRETRRHRWLSGDDEEWQVNDESHLNFSKLLNLVMRYPILAERLNGRVLGDTD